MPGGEGSAPCWGTGAGGTGELGWVGGSGGGWLGAWRGAWLLEWRLGVAHGWGMGEVGEWPDKVLEAGLRDGPDEEAVLGGF